MKYIHGRFHILLYFKNEYLLSPNECNLSRHAYFFVKQKAESNVVMTLVKVVSKLAESRSILVFSSVMEVSCAE